MYRNIRDLREDADMTQKQMAEMLHGSQLFLFPFPPPPLANPRSIRYTGCITHREARHEHPQ